MHGAMVAAHTQQWRLDGWRAEGHGLNSRYCAAPPKAIRLGRLRAHRESLFSEGSMNGGCVGGINEDRSKQLWYWRKFTREVQY